MNKSSASLIISFILSAAAHAQSGVPKYASGSCSEFTYFQQKLSCSTVMYLSESPSKASLIFNIGDTTYYFTGQANNPTFAGDYILELESVAKMQAGKNADVFKAEGLCTASLDSEGVTLTNLTCEAKPNVPNASVTIRVLFQSDGKPIQ